MLLDIIFKGGLVMIPLLLCSVIALAVGLEKFIYLRKTKTNTWKLMNKVEFLVKQGNITEALQTVKQQDGPISSILAAALSRHDRKREQIQEYLQTVGDNEVHKMEKRLVILDIIATISPLLGLLGTVIGIISSFNILAAAHGAASPAALSVGIAEALITTATGLVIAIPTMIIYTYLIQLVERRVNEMKNCATELLDILTSRGEAL